MRHRILLLLTGLAIAPTAALFIGLLTGSLREGRLTLEWPLLAEPGISSGPELLVAALPGTLLFVVCGLLAPRRATLAAGFVGGALLSCVLAAAIFAHAFGNTWSAGEIVMELVVMQLHLVALALLPGTLLTVLIGRPLRG
jgi:hypothetical protein